MRCLSGHVVTDLSLSSRAGLRLSAGFSSILEFLPESV